MADEPQSPPAAEAATGGQAEPTASAPPLSATGGPDSWAAAFVAHDDGASNRGTDPTPEPATPAPAADSAPSDEGGASNADGASTEKDGAPEVTAEGDKPTGQREPQPGSRRSTAAELEAQKAENERLREQFETWAKERDEQARTAQQKADDEAKAKAEAEAAVEGILGKPGEMAALLAKLADTRRPGSTVEFTLEDENRLIELTNGARLYQPLLERARAEAQTSVGQTAQAQIAEAKAQADGLMRAWGEQFEAAVTLDLPGLEEQALRKAPDMAGIVKAAHAAGSASRDGEIAELQGRLTDAQTRAFASQPQLATGGVSGNGRTVAGYDGTKSPVSNLEESFANEPAIAPNGRR